jgi:hypothetical protein
MTLPKNYKEDYIQIAQHHWVKKDNFHYYTEKDIIKRVSEKYNIEEREVADMYRLLIQHIKSHIENFNNDYDSGYYFTNLGTFFKKRLFVEDLFKGKNTVRYLKAKKQLDYYMKFDSTIMKIV